jgi:hypothetical protein
MKTRPHVAASSKRVRWKRRLLVVVSLGLGLVILMAVAIALMMLHALAQPRGLVQIANQAGDVVVVTLSRVDDDGRVVQPSRPPIRLERDQGSLQMYEVSSYLVDVRDSRGEQVFCRVYGWNELIKSVMITRGEIQCP